MQLSEQLDVPKDGQVRKEKSGSKGGRPGPAIKFLMNKGGGKA